MNNTNPLTEIILGVIAVFFVVGGVFLLYVGKIDFAGAALMFGFPAALFGINQALKAPSPAQQQQLGALVQQGQQLTSQALSVLPTVVAATQQPAPPPPPAPVPPEVK